MKDNGFKLAKESSRRYPSQTITNVDYADDIELLANTPAQAESLRHSLEPAAAGIDLQAYADNTEYMCFPQTGDTSTLNGSSLKLAEKFTNLGSSISSTETEINTQLTKAWTAIDRLSVIWTSDLTDKIKHSFFQTTWTLTKGMEEKLDGSYTRMLRAILNKSCRQHPTMQQLYGHLPRITKTIQVRRTRHAGYCWRNEDEHISDILLWNSSHERPKV